MSDLLLRGRGADVGVRAPVVLLRLSGAALGFAVYTLAESLGLAAIVGIEAWVGQLIALVIGAYLAPTRFGSLLWLVAGTLTLVACIVSYTPVAAPFARTFVRADAERGGAVDAVAVLSGGMTDDGRVSGAAVDRLLTGLAVAKERRIPSVALSVLERTKPTFRVTSEADQRALAALIAPEADVRFVREVSSTRDEALAFAALARTHGWMRVLLVTSPTHTRRACAAVEAAGLAVQCLPSRSREYSIVRLDGAAARRHAFADALYEVAALLLYEARGWMP